MADERAFLEKELDFTSSSFNALKALYSRNLKPPVPSARIFNNINEYARSLSARNIQPKQGDLAARLKNIAENNVSKLRNRKRDPKKLEHLMKVKNQTDGLVEKVAMLEKTKKKGQQKTVLERMEENYKEGPLSVLYKCVEKKTKLKVWTRKLKGLHGLCVGYLIAFDKHMNLAMMDVDEMFAIEEEVVLDPQESLENSLKKLERKKDKKRKWRRKKRQALRRNEEETMIENEAGMDIESGGKYNTNMKLLESDETTKSEICPGSNKDIPQRRDAIEESLEQKETHKVVKLDWKKYFDIAKKDKISPGMDTQIKPLTGERTTDSDSDEQKRSSQISGSFSSAEVAGDAELIREDTHTKDVSTNDGESKDDDSLGEEAPKTNELTIFGIMNEVKRTESELKEAGALLSNDKNTDTYPCKPFSILQGNVVAMEFDEGSQDSTIYERTVDEQGGDMGVQSVTIHHKITYGMEGTRAGVKQDFANVGTLVDAAPDGNDGGVEFDSSTSQSDGKGIGENDYDDGDDDGISNGIKSDSSTNKAGKTGVGENDYNADEDVSMEEVGSITDGDCLDNDQCSTGNENDGNREDDAHSIAHVVATDEHDCVKESCDGDKIIADIDDVKLTGDTNEGTNLNKQEEAKLSSTVKNEEGSGGEGKHFATSATVVSDDVSQSENMEITNQENADAKEEGELSSSSDCENVDVSASKHKKTQKDEDNDKGKDKEIHSMSLTQQRSGKVKDNSRVGKTGQKFEKARRWSTGERTVEEDDRSSRRVKREDRTEGRKSSSSKERKSEKDNIKGTDKKQSSTTKLTVVNTGDKKGKKGNSSSRKVERKEVTASNERKREKDDVKTTEKKQLLSTTQKRCGIEKSDDKDRSSGKDGTKDNTERKPVVKESKSKTDKLNTSTRTTDARSRVSLTKSKSIRSNQDGRTKSEEDSCGRQRKCIENAKGTSKEDRTRQKESERRESRSSSASSTTRNFSRSKEESSKEQVEKSRRSTSSVEDFNKRTTRKSSSQSTSRRSSKESMKLPKEMQGKEKDVKPNKIVSEDNKKERDRKSVGEKSSTSETRRSSRLSVKTKSGGGTDKKTNTQEASKEDVKKTKVKTDVKMTSAKKSELTKQVDSGKRSRDNLSTKREKSSSKESVERKEVSYITKKTTGKKDLDTMVADGNKKSESESDQKIDNSVQQECGSLKTRSITKRVITERLSHKRIQQSTKSKSQVHKVSEKKSSGKRKRDDTPLRSQKVRKTTQSDKGKDRAKVIKTKEAKLPGNVITVRILKVDRGKALVLKRRHVNQIFIKGDNVIMVAHDVGPSELYNK